jgi:hypothetical protein
MCVPNMRNARTTNDRVKRLQFYILQRTQRLLLQAQLRLRLNVIRHRASPSGVDIWTPYGIHSDSHKVGICAASSNPPLGVGTMSPTLHSSLERAQRE